ncbi:MAG: AAA family ATPase [Fibrobacter sp.]|nr:AAA family ATPase [Fibrobacter sp.]
MGYTEYWGLKEKPFEELCDTRFFFQSADHREALDRLLYVVNDRNMNIGLLTGEVGSGKTITKNVLIRSLPPQQFEIIDFENSNFSFTDLVYDILQRITYKDARLDLMDDSGIPERSDKYLLIQILKKKLETLLYEEKRHLVLIFDEAQQIEESVLDEIKNLTNISSRTENFLTIFLVGQPELREKVRRLKQVDQRIFLRFHLNNLDYNGAISYIAHRLQVGGCPNQSIFTSLGQEIIFRSTGGVPREINRLCKLSLNYGYAHSLKEISREDIQVILDDLQEHS